MGNSILSNQSDYINVFVSTSNVGAGMCWKFQWIYINLKEDFPDIHLAKQCKKEMMIIAPASIHWNDNWSNNAVCVYSTNKVSVLLD